MQTEQLELSLPYEVIEDKAIAGRTYLRENFTVSSRVAYKIPFSQLEIREGFNKRIVYEGIEALAASIKANGLSEPLTVDVLNTGRVIIEKGHRRYKALQMLIEQGEIIEFVECYPNSSKVTEKQRMQDVFNSNMFSSKLNTVEQANTVFDLKNNFGKISNEDIAKGLGISRQQVDNLLLIASADDSVKNQILMNEINVTEALKFIRDAKKLGKQTDDAEMEGNKTSAAKTKLPHDPNAEELAELKEMEKQVANNDEDHLPFVEETAEQEAVREQAEAEKAMEQLLLVADEVKVKKLNNHLDKKLAAAVKATVKEGFVDESTGETISKERTVFYLNKGTVISADIIEQLSENKVETVFLFKPGCEPVAPSVITEPVATKEKDRYDSSRPEVAQVQNIIKLADKLEFQVSKLDIPDGAKKDIADIVKWMQKDAQELREWVHTNKKQNKIR